MDKEHGYRVWEWTGSKFDTDVVVVGRWMLGWVLGGCRKGTSPVGEGRRRTLGTGSQWVP